MAQTSIPVPAGIVGHGRTYDAIVLRQPTFREYMDIGEVLEWVIYPNGMRIPTYNNATIEQYFKTCLMEPRDPLLIESQGDMKLAQDIRQAIIGFFQPASPVVDGSRTSPETSSGDAAKDVSAPAT